MYNNVLELISLYALLVLLLTSTHFLCSFVTQYGYYMSARFKDGTVNGDLISCKISRCNFGASF
jgi:hypothetical protein